MTNFIEEFYYGNMIRRRAASSRTKRYSAICRR